MQSLRKVQKLFAVMRMAGRPQQIKHETGGIREKNQDYEKEAINVEEVVKNQQDHMSKPFRCYISYSSAFSDLKGIQDIKQRLLKKYPELDVITEHSKDNDFHVKIQKKAEDEVLVDSRILPEEIGKRGEQLYAQVESHVEDVFGRGFGYSSFMDDEKFMNDRDHRTKVVAARENRNE